MKEQMAKDKLHIDQMSKWLEVLRNIKETTQAVRNEIQVRYIFIYKFHFNIQRMHFHIFHIYIFKITIRSLKMPTSFWSETTGCVWRQSWTEKWNSVQAISAWLRPSKPRMLNYNWKMISLGQFNILFISFIWPGRLVQITNVSSWLSRSEVQMIEENLALKNMNREVSCTTLNLLYDKMENVPTILQNKLLPRVRKSFYCCLFSSIY